MEPPVSSSSSSPPPSSSATRSLPRVCLVLPVSDVVNDFQCNMYVIDLNSREDVTVQLTPKIHMSGEFFRNAALCVVEWTIFVFEGYSDDGDGSSKSIYKYALDPNTTYESLKETSLKEWGSMESTKVSPTTILAPRGDKVVVFSTTIHSDRCDFELFDFHTKKCIKLPQLRVLGNYFTPYEDAGCLVQYYSFINDSVMLVQTSTGGMHVIDLRKYLFDNLNPEEPTWRPYRFPICGVLNLSTSFQLIGEEGDLGNGICLTPFGAYDFGIGNSRCNWYYVYPHPSLPSDEEGTYHIIPLDVTDPSRPTFCTFSVTMAADHPTMTMDVYECDVGDCKSEFAFNRQSERTLGLRLPGTTSINSLRNICLDLQCSNYMYVRHTSTIPDDAGGSIPTVPLTCSVQERIQGFITEEGGEK